MISGDICPDASTLPNLPLTAVGYKDMVIRDKQRRCGQIRLYLDGGKDVEVLLDSEAPEQDIVLGAVAKVASGSPRLGQHALAQHLAVAPIRPHQPRQHADGRRLARAVVTQQGCDASHVQFQAQTLHGHMRSIHLQIHKLRKSARRYDPAELRCPQYAVPSSDPSLPHAFHTYNIHMFNRYQQSIMTQQSCDASSMQSQAQTLLCHMLSIHLQCTHVQQMSAKRCDSAGL